MIQATYGLWLAHNEARDGKRIAAPHDIIATIVAHLQEWRAVHAVQQQPAVPKSRQKWQPPDEGWLKLNADGATSRHGDIGGGGVVLRDHQGTFRARL